MKTEELIRRFRAHQNSDKQKQMEQYMRNQFRFLGLQATERRALAKDFLKGKQTEAKEKWQQATKEESVIDWNMLFLLWELPEREFQLSGLDYLKLVQPYFILDDLKNLRQLVRTKSWWDTVDSLAKSIGFLVQKENQLMDEMKTWSIDDNIWIRRVSILHQLSFKEATNTELLREVILNNTNEDEFFIQKAIGWALREYAKTDEEWTREFVSVFQEELSPLSIREATKHLKK